MGTIDVNEIIREDLKDLDWNSYLKFLEKKPFISSDHKRFYIFGNLLGIMKDKETKCVKIIIHSTADVPGCWRVYEGDEMCPEFLIEFSKLIKNFRIIISKDYD